MKPHTWYKHDEDCAQVGIETFTTCSECGADFCESGIVRQVGLWAINIPDLPADDCDAAQRLTRWYLRAHIHGFMKAMDRTPIGYDERLFKEVRKAIEDGPLVSVTEAYARLMEGRYEEVRVLLHGPRPVGELLDVQL